MGKYRNHITTALGVVLLMAGGAMAAHAQTARFRTIETRAEGATVAIEATWPWSLQAALDSTGATALTVEAARAMARGMASVSEAYTLPALAPATVRVRNADYEEVHLARGAASDTLLAELSRPTAAMVGLGLARKEPTQTLVARLLSYDAAQQVLRRYRRLVVDVTYGRAVQPIAAKAGNAGNPHLLVQQSVLASGIVYKVPITRTGVYRIDRDFLSGLAGLEVGPEDIEPNDVRVYDNGGRPLPAVNGDPRPADLVETPVLVQGGGDGSFDSGDQILFYAQGPRGWTYDADDGLWTHYVNPFSNQSFVFVKIDAGAGKRVGNDPFPNLPNAQVVTQVTGRYVRDFDDFMWSRENGSGHTWHSRTVESGSTIDVFSNVTLPGLLSGTVQYVAKVAIQSNPVAYVSFLSNGVEIGRINAPRITFVDSVEQPIADANEGTFTQQVSAGGAIDVDMRVQSRQIRPPRAAIDWVRLFYPKGLQASDDSLRFTTPAGQTGTFAFNLTNFSREPQVWDVTEPGTVRRLGVAAAGNGYRVQVRADDAAQPREIFAFVPGLSMQPDASLATRVENQNLHGITGFPTYVIVTPREFQSAAEALAEHRRGDGLTVVVAPVEQIYNEFAGGIADMRAVRDYLKFLYDRAATEATMPRYALLFGDGHFNFRNLGATPPALTNWVLPYETEASLDPQKTYTSDDYFGLLDDDEGAWPFGSIETPAPAGAIVERVDLGVGRFPVQSVDEAELMVRKIEHYEDPATFGPWRSRYTFVSDDGYNGLAGDRESDPLLHTQNSEVVADLLAQYAPELNLKKIYGVTYDRQFINGWRLPGQKRDIRQTVEDGTLFLNYSGHGGEDGLAQEEVLTRDDARSFQNFDRLTIFVTATCSFGWWDLQQEQSGAEVLLLNENGGAIALMTTVRLVYTSRSLTSLNVGLNRSLNTEMFKPDDEGLPRRLGDVMYETKNSTAGLQGNNRKFNLLGDPAMRIGLATSPIALTAINGEPLDHPLQMKALERVAIDGAVQTRAGDVDAAFDGPVSVSVFDAERLVSTNFPDRDYSTVSIREDLIWRGTVPATNGRFTANFVVPKDISYSNEPGRVSAYAWDDAGQRLGYSEQFVVGGTADNPPDDSEGPAVGLFLNDTTFVSGGFTAPNPTLIVRLDDESGINTVGAGVGHEMLLVVDGDEQNAVDLSDNFESEPNSFERGQVRYSFENYPVSLGEGPHTLTVRAWDVLNNSTTASLDFVLGTAGDLELRNVLNYPNPTSGRTRIVFEHNQPPGTRARVQVRIFTLAGRPVKTFSTDDVLPSGVLSGGPVQVQWDGRDEDFDPVASGIYLYRVRVEVERQVSEKIEKIAVIR